MSQIWSHVPVRSDGWPQKDSHGHDFPWSRHMWGLKILIRPSNVGLITSNDRLWTVWGVQELACHFTPSCKYEEKLYRLGCRHGQCLQVTNWSLMPIWMIFTTVWTERRFFSLIHSDDREHELKIKRQNFTHRITWHHANFTQTELICAAGENKAHLISSSFSFAKSLGEVRGPNVTECKKTS